MVHLPGFLQDVHFKITDKSPYVLYLCIGAQGDFRMLRHIDHFGGEYAGGAVQGGKRLIQLSHAPPNAGFALYQHYLIVGIGDVQCCLDTGYASPDDQCPFGDPNLPGEKGFEIGNLGYRHPYKLDSLIGSCLLVVSVYPATMLSYIGYLQLIRIKPGRVDGFTEGFLVHSG